MKSVPSTPASMAASRMKPSLVGVPWILNVWKRDLTELPGLIAEIKSFYAGTHAQAARFLADHNIRYVVWSVRESRDIDNMEENCRPDRIRFSLDGILSIRRCSHSVCGFADECGPVLSVALMRATHR